jgi:diaminopimelate epimerase
MNFTKMHGIGNDFVVVDDLAGARKDASLRALAVSTCDRRFGIGADGLLLVCGGSSVPFRMRMFNPDGSESEMCGNGIRCFAKYLVDNGLAQDPAISVETGAGVLELQIEPKGDVRVDMGKARLTRGAVGMLGPADETCVEQPLNAAGQVLAGTAVSMGNPHVVFFVDDVAAVPLESWGPAFENHREFPKRVNVHFVQVIDRTHLRQRTWERGAGVTLACGTGACACAVAAITTGRAERQLTVRLPGGDLRIRYTEDGSVFMSGPAATVFTGTWPE